MSNRFFNFKAVAAGEIDVNSFIAGVGPSFGLALGHWFRGEEAERAGHH